MFRNRKEKEYIYHVFYPFANHSETLTVPLSTSFGELLERIAYPFDLDSNSFRLFKAKDEISLPSNVEARAIFKKGDHIHVRMKEADSNIPPVTPLVIPDPVQNLAFSDTSTDAVYAQAIASSLEDEPPIIDTTTPRVPNLCTGQISQYSCGGSSACTSICLTAAMCFLGSLDCSRTSGSDLDAIVQEGVMRHAGRQHTDVEDMWELPTFRAAREALVRHDPIRGHLAHDRWDDVLSRALANCSCAAKLALIVTKAPETILCLFDTGLWYLFDSHGEAASEPKVVYLKQAGSLSKLAELLRSKYIPVVMDDGNSLLAETINMFELHPFTGQSTRTPIVAEALNNSSSPIMDSPSTVVNEATVFVPQTVAQQPVMDTHIDRDDYVCAILQVEIMADPVKCIDGYTYERANIERHIQSRIEAEEARERQEREGSGYDDSVCCNQRRGPIVVQSPRSNEALDSFNLIPDRNLEITIVRLVQSPDNPLQMDSDEIADWNRRREEKARNDAQRQLDRQAALENQQRMEEQAALAEERRRLEREESNGSNPTPEVLQVSVAIVRDVRSDTGKLSKNDMGLSLDLCSETERIPDTFGSSRCMVSRCARQLYRENRQWCSRCGRQVCSSCNQYEVSSSKEPSRNTLHSICFDCASEAVDSLPRSGSTRDCQVRDILRNLVIAKAREEKQSNVFQIQDTVIRKDVFAVFQSEIERHRQDLRRLEHQGSELNAQVENLQSQPLIVEATEGNDNQSTGDGIIDPIGAYHGELEDMQEEIQRKETEFSSLLAAGYDETDEEDTIRFVCRREELANGLERLQAQIMNVHESLLPSDDVPPVTAIPSQSNMTELIALLESMETRLPSGIFHMSRRRRGKQVLKKLRNLFYVLVDLEQSEQEDDPLYSETINGIRSSIQELPTAHSRAFQNEIVQILHAMRVKESSTSAATDDLPRAAGNPSGTTSSSGLVSQDDGESDTHDPTVELARLKSIDASQLAEEEQLQHILLISAMQQAIGVSTQVEEEQLEQALRVSRQDMADNAEEGLDQNANASQEAPSVERTSASSSSSQAGFYLSFLVPHLE